MGATNCDMSGNDKTLVRASCSAIWWAMIMSFCIKRSYGKALRRHEKRALPCLIALDARVLSAACTDIYL